MAEDWIIDVLNDVRSFARLNGLDRLTEQLDQTLHVATRELAARGRVEQAVLMSKLPRRH